MVSLAGGPLRRLDILKTVNSYGIDVEWPGKPLVMHDSILSRTLRKMVDEGLLDRHETENVFPPQVSYSLRPEAAAFLRDLRGISGWSERNPHIVTSAQEYSYS
jgi:DNA-binding HxlR family transcriptional regulator